MIVSCWLAWTVTGVCIWAVVELLVAVGIGKACSLGGG